VAEYYEPRKHRSLILSKVIVGLYSDGGVNSRRIARIGDEGKSK